MSIASAESLVDKLRRLDKEATPGEWTLQTQSYPWNRRILTGHRTVLVNGSNIELAENAALIVAMRNALPELLRLVEAAERVAADYDCCDELTMRGTVANVYMGELLSALPALVEPLTESQTP